MIKRIAQTAGFTGLLAALLLTLLQSFWVSPLILQAETYEKSEPAAVEVQEHAAGTAAQHIAEGSAKTAALAVTSARGEITADEHGDDRQQLAQRRRIDPRLPRRVVRDLSAHVLRAENPAEEVVALDDVGGLIADDRFSEHRPAHAAEHGLDGARAAYGELRPIVAERDAALAKTVDRRFKEVQTALSEHAEGDTYVTYDKLTKADTRKLADAVDGLSEPLSRVSGVVLK